MRLRAHSPIAKLLAAFAIAVLCTALSLLAARLPGLSIAMLAADQTLYDSLYKLRPIENKTDADIIIVAVDQKSLDAVALAPNWQYGWPWPRDFWGAAAKYVDSCHPKAIVFDLLFSELSAYRDIGDDDSFADKLKATTSPIIFASRVSPDGKFGNFAVPFNRAILGAANTSSNKVIRQYQPIVNGQSSEAAAALRAIANDSPNLPPSFLLHFYGPYSTASGQHTFRYISAVNVIQAGLDPKTAASVGITPDLFRGKIVLFGAIAAGTYDLKSTPLSAEYPGVEVQATAIENLLHHQFVQPASSRGVAVATLVTALLASIGVVLPRKASVKLLGAILPVACLLRIALTLFISPDIVWLPLACPLLAAVIATVIAFTWSYLTEDRQRRFALKALSQYVSPAVTEQLARDPARLKLGGERRMMSVIFTDIAGFTDLSETLDVTKLSELLNFYLDQMSETILATDGTLDKYVGDAIIGFWNAPVDQSDHALHAPADPPCAAPPRDRNPTRIAKARRSALHTRIGVNTGPMAVGNMGSKRKFNYSVLGDSVNFASRLEGANKFYGTRILIAETTAEIVRDAFLFRQVDLLRVKGKTQAVAVYELLAEKPADPALTDLAQHYQSALDHYRRRRWDAAERILLEIRQRFAEDGPSTVLLQRIAQFRLDPPSDNWDGVYIAKEK